MTPHPFPRLSLVLGVVGLACDLVADALRHRGDDVARLTRERDAALEARDAYAENARRYHREREQARAEAETCRAAWAVRGREIAALEARLVEVTAGGLAAMAEAERLSGEVRRMRGAG